MKLVRLKFKSALHIGADNGGIGRENVQDIVHSDTLFSMMVNSCAEIERGDMTQIDAFINSVGHVSSGFLFEQKRSGYEYYLPRPLIDPPDFLGEFGTKRRLKYAKTLKRCAYMRLGDFAKWTAGEKIGETTLKKGSEPEYKKLFAMRTTPQHARDRLTSASHLYHSGEMFFKGNAGLYFLVDGVDASWLEAVLKNAAIKGLGGRRSLGKGAFDYEIVSTDDEWKGLFKNKGNHFVTISLYSPTEKEMTGFTPNAYSLTLRKGWTFSSMLHGQFKRKTCTMFGEGSVFSKKPEGRLLDVTPDPASLYPHRFYRFGKALSVPCKMSEENHG